MLHGLRAEIGAQLLQLAGFAVLKAEHVQDANKAISGMSQGMIQQGHGSVGFSGARSSDRGSMMTCNLPMKTRNSIYRSFET